ncbi:MAG: asparagine synthase C-terminal domain-containing protein, partial [Gemmatimonadota bacterium]|nr:asparagine synthase C-terminal domain-containing protein [Gemmatimonadota bacterium]
TFLSGGIDSSLMTAMAAPRVPGRLPTFSIGSTSVDFNELPLARTVAAQYGTEHHEEIARPDLITLLPEMVYHLDMPGDPIAACQYHVARLAAAHVKVALGGDGGDELFGGYDRFVGFGLIDYYAALPRGVRSKVIGPLLDRLIDSATYKSSVAKLRWMHALSFSRGGERYADATAYFRFDQTGLADLYAPELSSRLAGIDPRTPIMDAFDAIEEAEVLDRMLHADVTTRLPEHLLILFDRMTMAQSMEGRSPLLDHEVAEFAARLPVDMKIKGRRLKYLLRKVAERHVPEAITNAPKRGFMFPIAHWLKNELRDVTRHLLVEDSRFVERGFFRRDALVRLLEEHQSGQSDHHHRIWMLVNLEVWHRIFLENRRLEEVSEDLRETAKPRSLATA